MSSSDIFCFYFGRGFLMAKGISLNKKKAMIFMDYFFCRPLNHSLKHFTSILYNLSVSFRHLPFLTFTSQVGDSDGSESPMSFLA